MNKCLIKYEELKLTKNVNSNFGNKTLNDVLYNFFLNFCSYVNIFKENANLKDFLNQKSFKFSDINKEEIEIIKKISLTKFGEGISILELYKKKKKIYMKTINSTFNILKEKILNEREELNNNEPLNEFLTLTKPPLELQMNFDELKYDDNYSIINYQIFNIFPKIRELSLNVSEISVYILYSLILYCPKLTSLKITVFKNNEKTEKIVNGLLSLLISSLKFLNEFSLNNIIIESDKVEGFVNEIKKSQIKKLTINHCINSKNDLQFFIPYFSNANQLTEINLSGHQFHIPKLLSNSLLNYELSKQLTTINFNSCSLDEEDIKYIANYIVSSSSLLVCDIGNNYLSQLACSTFGYSIIKTSSLETLRMNDCGINGESLLFLFNGKGSKPLKNVNLNGNIFGDIGLVSVSAFLKSSPKLESIELKNVGGTDMGFISIINTIQFNAESKMKYVNFEKNNITSVSLQSIKAFNDKFRAKGVIFTINKIEGENQDIDCVVYA